MSAHALIKLLRSKAVQKTICLSARTSCAQFIPAAAAPPRARRRPGPRAVRGGGGSVILMCTIYCAPDPSAPQRDPAEAAVRSAAAAAAA